MRWIMDLKRPRWMAWLPHVAIAVFFVLCYFGFRKDFGRVSIHALPPLYGLYGAVVVLVIVSYVIRAMRWRKYLQELGYELPRTYAVITYIAGFAYTLAPGKVGELMKASYYRPYNIPLTAVTAAFYVERLLDLAVFVCIALIFMGFSARGYGTLLVVAGLCVPLAGILTVLIKTHHLDRIARSCWRWSSGLGAIASRFSVAVESAQTLLSPRVVMVGFFWGLLGWMSECLSLYVLGDMVPQTPLAMNDALGMYASAIVVGAISFLPGGLGTTEAALVALLVNYGYGFQDAVVMTAVCRLLTLWVAVLLGWIAVGYLRLSGRRRIS